MAERMTSGPPRCSHCGGKHVVSQSSNEWFCRECCHVQNEDGSPVVRRTNGNSELIARIEQQAVKISRLEEIILKKDAEIEALIERLEPTSPY